MIARSQIVINILLFRKNTGNNNFSTFDIFYVYIYAYTILCISTFFFIINRYVDIELYTFVNISESI